MDTEVVCRMVRLFLSQLFKCMLSCKIVSHTIHTTDVISDSKLIPKPNYTAWRQRQVCVTYFLLSCVHVLEITEFKDYFVSCNSCEKGTENIRIVIWL